MAAAMVGCVLLLFVMLVQLPRRSVCQTGLPVYRPDEIWEILDDSCFIGINIPAGVEVEETFNKLREIYSAERHVIVGGLQREGFVWPNGEPLEINGRQCEAAESKSGSGCPVFFAKRNIDRSCLLSPAHTKLLPTAEVVRGANNLATLVEYINAKCGTFRKPDGRLLPAGQHRQYILENVFTVDQISNVTMRMLYDSGEGINVDFMPTESSQRVCDGDGCRTSEANRFVSKKPEVVMPQCEIIDKNSFDQDDFFHFYLKRSQPVILKDAAGGWPAFTKWTQEYLRQMYGNRRVHIKLTPGGDFEGVEPAELWDDYGTFTIPDEVLRKLPFPDLVVVRPAGINMKFSEFLDLISWAANQPARNVSAYLEYSSIPEYMPELVHDIEEFSFVKDFLKLRHLNMWLSDGNTVGRLHFDPFDNFLCQLRGRKQLILFEPFNNSRLYEGHIPQATLSYNQMEKSFHRKTLEDSTSMVMSPVDLLNPDFERFPYFKEARPLNCTIDEGDVLFMPSFWWHEVYSFPNMGEKRNLAVNFWYEPFLTREFPCSDCPMDINPYYYHLLY